MSVKTGNHVEFFRFVQYAVNPYSVLLLNQKSFSWRSFFQYVREQAISGVLFEGVKRLGEQGTNPPFNVLIEWVAISEQIEGQNRLLNKKCVELVKEYQDAGFYCVVLKGQGNAMMYPNPYSRTPGDIDLWVIPANGRCRRDNVRRDVTQYVRERPSEDIKVRYYHVGYQDNGVVH